MADKRVYLHIGAPKTGTTYLQAVLARNRKRLGQNGILYPSAMADAQHTAVWDLRGTPSQRKDAGGIEGAWDALVTEVAAYGGPAVVISSEMFVYCTDKQIAKAVTAFDRETHVVYTARDLVRQVPAVYQERIKNQQTLTYAAFLTALAGEGRAARSQGFWRAQDAAAVLERWVAHVPAPRIHLVTAPPASAPRSLLLERFIRVFDIDADDLRVDVRGSNESLGVVQTELLRRYNQRHGNTMPWPLYRRTIRVHLADVFGAVVDPRRLTLSDAERRWFTDRAVRIVERLRPAEYDVVGDLADLIPVDEPMPPPVEASEAEVLDAAIDALHAALAVQEAANRAAKKTARRAAKRLGTGA